ncbi:hypothetical protein Clacol_007991 [Clathrus columnatus]|uniref:Protein ARV n=1 Tax=Clathrus columnatus TaxID=1419009 RepID=A0AAV5AP98_9AGAM|nr:hypothetical protein Clacol_007991 [Clathrus columnatus]
MPICTTCTASVEYLYTLYETKNNLRLKECPKCLSFADPYVEYDTLTLLLDLILLKRGVYRHLLFNRGWPPENHGESSESLRSKRVKFINERERFRRQEPSSIVKESKPENTPTPNAEHARYTNLPILSDLLNLLDEDKLDRHWIVRNVIGGMAAGFGLRVALDCHPSLTALIIMVGWTFKAWVSHFASQWLGITEDAEWMAYSIP